VALALFDLDNTLLDGDSDHAWGIYLTEIGVVDADFHQRKQDEYYQQYIDGSLDIIEFLNFQLATLAQHPMSQLLQWRESFINDVIQPMIDTGKPQLLDKHRDAGDTLVIITATSDFVTRPIAERLGINTLIATEAEIIDNKYTGKVAGTPCFQSGKVTRLHDWLQSRDETLENSWFYSDSYNDLPLLKLVDNPIVVTPDDKLREHAEQQHWPVID